MRQKWEFPFLPKGMLSEDNADGATYDSNFRKNFPVNLATDDSFDVSFVCDDELSTISKVHASCVAWCRCNNRSSFRDAIVAHGDGNQRPLLRSGYCPKSSFVVSQVAPCSVGKVGVLWKERFNEGIGVHLRHRGVGSYQNIASSVKNLFHWRFGKDLIDMTLEITRRTSIGNRRKSLKSGWPLPLEIMNGRNIRRATE